MRAAVAAFGLALVAGLVVAVAPAGATPAALPLRVTTSSGVLQGLQTSSAREFLGVRYARPPVGELRWRDPQPVIRAPGVVDATEPGSPCPQQSAVPGGAATGSTDEDCLFLNVTTPRTVAPGVRLPVMVWWHGGGDTSGAGAAYDAQRLASQGDVVVVTVNYRLGVFGYLGLPGLDGGGDFGLADQLAATRWARTNAAAFGGDPTNITVFGESSGAMSACAALTSPSFTGLAQRVAMSSGSCDLAWPASGLLPGTPAQTPYVTRAASDRLGVTEAAALGCTGSTVLACMQRQSVPRLLTINPLFSNALAYGTPLLPRDPAVAAREGHVAAVPMISGGNAREESAFVGGVQQADPSTYTAATYPRLVATAFPSSARWVLTEYPVDHSVSPAASFADLITDSSWRCPSLATDDALSRRAPVYSYEFGPSESPNVNGVTIASVPQTAAHADDVPYLFDLGGRNLLRTARERALGAQMIAYWSSFARTGVPTADGSSAWPVHSGTGRPVLLLGDRVGTTDVAARHDCAFWAGLQH